MPGELGAVVVRDADARAGRQRREHVQLRPDALAGGLVRNDAGHEEPGPPLHLGVQVCVLMLLYIVKCLGVLFWVGDGVNPLDGPLFEFGQVSSTSFDFADAAGRHA